MKGMYAPAIGVLLSVIVVSIGNAAPTGSPLKPMPTPQQGIANAKKAMQSRLERDKKVREAKEKGYARRQQLQSGEQF